MLYQWPTLLRNDGSKITIVNPSVNPILLAQKKKLYLNETYYRETQRRHDRDIALFLWFVVVGIFVFFLH